MKQTFKMNFNVEIHDSCSNKKIFPYLSSSILQSNSPSQLLQQNVFALF